MSRKIIFIGPAYPYKGGIAAFNESMATTFKENGWACKMFTFSDQYSFTSKDKLTTEDPRPNLTIKRGIYSANPLNWLKMSKAIVQEKPELVITQYWMPYMAPAFGTILRGIKKEIPEVKIATIVHTFKADQARIGDKQLNKYITNRTDLLYCLSDLVKEEVQTSVTDKQVQKIFHPIYDHYGEALSNKAAKEIMGWDKNKKQLLFFGEVREYKGLQLLLEALSLQKADAQYELIVAGEFVEPQKKYDKLIQRLNLEDKVTIRNQYIPNDEVPALFCAADAIVTPYKRKSQSGIIPVALHFQRPVLMTDIGEMAELIREHKLGLVSENNSASFAQKLDSFLSDQVELSSNYSQIKKELSWQSFYTNFMKSLEVYEV